MKLSLVAAYDENKGVGINNTLPWHFSEDLKRFKNLTNHKTIIMGRNTFESLGRLLPNRKHIILSRDEAWTKEILTKYPEVLVFSDVNELMLFLDNSYAEDEEVFVIGGTSIWQFMFPFLDTLYLTHVKGTYKVDTYFPEWNEDEWKKTHVENFDDFSFINYERI